MVLQLLCDKHLALKRSKCSFDKEEVAYLGHIITAQGVAMDQSKVDAIQTWPTPASVRAVRGFLGLTGYYRCFINSYGEVAAPLTKFLKRESLRWTPETNVAFTTHDGVDDSTCSPASRLHQAVHVDWDASRSSFGAVLHQVAGLIAFFSHAVTPQHAKLVAYKRELIGLVKVVRHWRPYLWAQPFVVAALAAVGGIRLQHLLSDVLARHTI